MNFKDVQTEVRHPVRMYCRYIDKLFIVFKFEADEAKDLI